MIKTNLKINFRVNYLSLWGVELTVILGFSYFETGSKNMHDNLVLWIDDNFEPNLADVFEKVKDYSRVNSNSTHQSDK